MKNLIVVFFVAVFTVQVFAAQFDRSAVLPVLARDTKIAQTVMADYKAANRAAEKAANDLAAGFPDVPRKDREAAKATALCAIESNLNIMADKMETFHATMASIQSTMENGMTEGIGAMREKIDGLVTDFTAELVQQERSSSAMEKVYQISPDALSEADARKLNNAMDAMERRKTLLKKLQERRERIAAINETIQEKIEGVRAVMSAVEVRIAELKTEAYVVDILKKDHQIELATKDLGIGAGGDVGALFDSKSSRALDTALGQKTDTGISQRERLKLRMGEK